jgi:3-hydroxyacyl-[acyl-carrier-protein] dehydratase
MLLNHFYTLDKQESQEGKVSASISFTPSHKIFQGHFPGFPVVPGVCMMQILKEVMEVESGRKLKIISGDNLKFLSVINPEENRHVNISLAYSLSDKLYTVTGSIQNSQTTFFKFKGSFREA